MFWLLEHVGIPALSAYLAIRLWLWWRERPYRQARREQARRFSAHVERLERTIQAELRKPMP